MNWAPSSQDGALFHFRISSTWISTMHKSKSRTFRNALKALSPQQRARICEAIRRELALEDLSRTNSRREAWARMAIGLKPFPRTIHLEGC
jgi:hypothetical protein